MTNPLPSLSIGSKVARYPIIQGGMGIRISGANLAAAVANAGGIGIISAMGLGFNSPYFDPDEPNPKRRHQAFLEANRLALMDELALARRLSPKGIIGINVMVAAREYETMVQVAVEHGADLVIAGAGLPLRLPDYAIANPQVALMPIVSTLRAAQVICRKWQRQHQRLPDGFIVESPRYAGGHLGAKATEIDDPSLSADAVIPELCRYIKDVLKVEIPVIAAGGIVNRGDIEQRLALGASGVQLGTAFITTHECDADPRYKAFHLQGNEQETLLVPSPVGLPGRALRNAFTEKILAGTPNPKGQCIANCLKQCKFRDEQQNYCILQALDRASRGDITTGLVFSGGRSGVFKQLSSVAERIEQLVA